MSTTHAVTPPVATAPAARDRPWPTRGEWLVIVAAWGAWALLSIAPRIADARWGDRAGDDGALAAAAIEMVGWIAITAPILVVASRWGTMRSAVGRWVRFLVLGVLVAITMGALGTGVRRWLGARDLRAPWSAAWRVIGPVDGAPARIGPPRGWARPRPRVPRAPPLWFGILNAGVLYLAVLSAGLARAASQRERARGEDAARREARLEAQLAEARLAALRRQLDPHFLFNTLNAVSALVERDPRGVRRMLARLSDLLRFTTDGAERAEHALRDELALVDRYLEIMEVRLQGRLTVVRAIDATVTDAAVPTLVLQPIVENAIRHGVERRAGQARITLVARREGATVVLAVRDDGPGPAGAVDAEGADPFASDATIDVTAPDTRATSAIGANAPGSEAPRAGVGLANTRARLAALHGARASLALRREGGETVVELRLPYRSLS